MQDLTEIIERCQQGNALAWETLVRQQQGRVYGVAWHFLRNSEDAKEASQETFLKLYKGIKSYRGNAEEFVPWMLSITRNCCIDRLRRTRTRDRYESDIQYTAEVSQQEVNNPETTLNEEQRKKLIYKALDQFNEENREIVLFKEIQGMKIEDISKIMSLPVGTIKSRCNRARLKLAQLVKSFSEDLREEEPS